MSKDILSMDAIDTYFFFSSFCVPGTIEGTGDAAENKIDKISSSRAYIVAGEIENEHNEVNDIVCWKVISAMKKK